MNIVKLYAHQKRLQGHVCSDKDGNGKDDTSGWHRHNPDRIYDSVKESSNCSSPEQIGCNES